MRIWWLVFFTAFLMAGCATPKRVASNSNSEQSSSLEWQGRISVQVLGDAPSAMSASFFLRGSAKNGELDLYTPLGTTLGAFQWTPQWVRLRDGDKSQYFNNLAELTEKITGAPLPVDAIFGWLQGLDVQVPGWQADTSALQQGSLFARRTSPAPEVTLRIKLDQ